MTVYNQFTSRTRLLEATFERIRTVRHHDDLARAWEHEDPLDRLTDFISRVGHVWGVERVMFARLYALAALDPDFATVLQPRMERRRVALAGVVAALRERYGTPAEGEVSEIGDVLYAIVSFNTFEALARDGRSFEDVVPIVLRLAREAIGFPLVAA
jgi:AcrR family transcriptional regulator